MKHRVAAKKLSKFDAKTFLSTVDGGRKIAEFSNKQAIFVQDDSSDAVFYIQKGKVRLTVVSKSGKEATIGILNEGDFFGEGCLAGQTLRLSSATAMTDCSVMQIGKKYMIEVLHREHAFSDMFVAYLLTRNIRHEEDLVDQLFNSSAEAIGSDIVIIGSPRQGRKARIYDPEDESGDAGRDGGHDPLASELFHEQVQEIGIH